MPAPFSAPNPYGSYFSFNGPESAGASAGLLPGMSPGFSPAAGSMMGQGSGGFRPTMSEYSQGQARQQSQQQYISDVLRSDSRSQIVANILQQTMFANARQREATINRLGGQANFTEVISAILNRPGIAGYMGGSVTSIAGGAYSIATSGMNINGYGVYGDGPLQTAAAKKIHGTVMDRFYNPSGGANLRMTQGLNMDQIGGILSMGASQGAFSGMSLGKLDMVKGQSNFSMDAGTLKKITDFTSSAAKTISSLIDIYGDGSIAELMQKAQRITGLDFSHHGNAEVMRNRVNSLRTTASALGVDNRSMMDLAAGATDMGMGMGLDAASAGSVSQYATVRGSYAFRSRQGLGGTMELPSISAQELTRNAVRDAHGMMRDPLGARRSAVELMIQNGTIGAGDAGSVRERIQGFGTNDVGRMDAFIQEKYGVSLPSYIRGMGGSQQVFASLRPDAQLNVVGGNELDNQRRRDRIVGQITGRRAGGIGLGLDAAGSLSTLITDLQGKTVSQLAMASDQGVSDDKLKDILANDFIGRMNSGKYLAATKSLKSALGSGSMEGLTKDSLLMVQNNPYTQGYISKGDRADQLNAARTSAAMFTETDRGRIGQAAAQGFLDKLDHRDPRSVMAILASVKPDEVIGLDSPFNFTYKDYLGKDGRVNAAAVAGTAYEMQKRFSKTAEGRMLLKSLNLGGDHFKPGTTMHQGDAEMLLNTLNDPVSFSQKFKDFRTMKQQITGPDGRSMVGETFISNKTAQNVEDFYMAGLTANKMADFLAAKRGPDSISNFLGGASRYMMANEGDTINGRKITLDDKRQAMHVANKFGSKVELISELTPVQLKSLAEGNRSFGKSALDALMVRENQLQSAYGDVGPGGKGYEEKAKLVERRKILEDAGFQASSEVAGGQKIIGSLRLVGRDTLEFVNTSIGDKKN